MTHKWMIIPVFAFGLGCAQLTVSVDIYDGPLDIPPTKAERWVSLVQSSDLCNGDPGAQFSTKLDELGPDYTASIGDVCIDSGDNEKVGLKFNPERAKSTWADLSKANADFAEAKADHGTADDDQKAATKNKLQAPKHKLQEAERKLQEAEKKLQEATERLARAEEDRKEAQQARHDFRVEKCENDAKALWEHLRDNLESLWTQHLKQPSHEVCLANADLHEALQQRQSHLVERPNAKRQRRLEANAKAISVRVAILESAIADYQDGVAAVQGSMVVMELEDGTSVGPGIPELAKQLDAVLSLSADRGAGIAAEGPVDGRLAGYPLFDPYFIQVLRNTNPDDTQPDRNWAPLSRTVARATGGNNQFVMVREGLLVFRQKSLDFDPTPIIGAASASARLGLKVVGALASSYGISMPELGEGDTPKTPVPTSEAEVEALRQTTLANKRAEQQALRELAALLAKIEGDRELDTAKLQAELEKIIERYQGAVNVEK